MSRCGNTDICGYFQVRAGTDGQLKEQVMKKFCLSNREQCALYMVKSRIFSGYSLPEDHVLDEIGRLLGELNPDDRKGAERIIKRMVK